jgi:hypothetical protein
MIRVCSRTAFTPPFEKGGNPFATRICVVQPKAVP